MIRRSRWFWCDACNKATIYCNSCEGVSCHSPGCQKCRAEFAEARKQSADGNAPRRGRVPENRGPAQTWPDMA